MGRILQTSNRWPPLVLRLVTGVLFVVAGAGKFTHRSAEIESFAAWDVPWPAFSVTLAGVVELIGGVLLILGLLTRPVAIVLAMNMLGAILTAGRVEGGPIHLGVAPALLVVMLILIRTGGGRASVDRHRAAHTSNTI